MFATPKKILSDDDKVSCKLTGSRNRAALYSWSWIEISTIKGETAQNGGSASKLHYPNCVLRHSLRHMRNNNAAKLIKVGVSLQGWMQVKHTVQNRRASERGVEFHNMLVAKFPNISTYLPQNPSPSMYIWTVKWTRVTVAVVFNKTKWSVLWFRLEGQLCLLREVKVIPLEARCGPQGG